MSFVISLAPGRGTKLYLSQEKDFKIGLSTKETPIREVLTNVLMILGKTIAPADHLGIGISSTKMNVHVSANTEYMVINCSEESIQLDLEEDYKDHQVLYDPYKFENEIHNDFDPELFKNDNSVPEGYIDILTKWYSIKFTYPDYNYIFIRPGLGISIQTHKLREEFWEVLQGEPIIIADHNVMYNTPIGTKVKMQLGAMHTVINPMEKEWVLIKESYSGKFDEEDIIRVFNPNNYVSPNTN